MNSKINPDTNCSVQTFNRKSVPRQIVKFDNKKRTGCWQKLQDRTTSILAHSSFLRLLHHYGALDKQPKKHTDELNTCSFWELGRICLKHSDAESVASSPTTINSFNIFFLMGGTAPRPWAYHRRRCLDPGPLRPVPYAKQKVSYLVIYRPEVRNFDRINR